MIKRGILGSDIIEQMYLCTVDPVFEATIQADGRLVLTMFTLADEDDHKEFVDKLWDVGTELPEDDGPSCDSCICSQCEHYEKESCIACVGPGRLESEGKVKQKAEKVK